MNKINKVYTIIDIAKEAEVSTTTVSHVINKTRFVSPETTEKVLKVIAKRKFQINLAASSLRGKRTHLIGLIIPDVSNPVYAHLSKEIEEIFYKNQYSITICNSESVLDKEIYYLDVLRSRKVEAIIIVPTTNKKEHLKNIIEMRIPLVIVEREIEDLEANFIISDGFKGFYEATEYLIKLGHKNIGYIERPYNQSHSVLRFKGFTQALKDNNLKLNYKNFVRAEGFKFSDGYNAMLKIVSMENKPTAILVFDDVVAIGAMRAIADKGFLIPDDFSIISYDNIIIDNYLNPRLSSVSTPVKKIAKEITNLILNTSKNKTISARKIVILPVFKIRESIASPKNL